MKLPKGLLVYSEPVCEVCGFDWSDHLKAQKQRCIQIFKREKEAAGK